jgi:hypothetical protein
VSKVDGEDVVGELLDALHDEAFPALGPADYVLVFFILNGRGGTSRIS